MASAVSALTSKISKMSNKEVAIGIKRLRKAPLPKLPPRIAQRIKSLTLEEKRNAVRSVNPGLMSSMDELKRKLRELIAARKVPEKPVDWEKFKKYVPAPIVDHFKAEHARKLVYLNAVRDPKPVVDLYFRALLEEMTNANAAAKKSALKLWALVADLEKLEKLKADLDTITIDEVFERFPEIAAQVNKDIENNQWSPEELPEEEEHHH